MTMSSWINADAMLADIGKTMNEEMQKAAEPLIEKAVEEIEKEMRRRLGEMCIALVQHNFSVDRFGPDLRLIVNFKAKD